MTAVGFITLISVLSRLLGLLKKCIIIIYILCIDCAENNKILFDLIKSYTKNFKITKNQKKTQKNLKIHSQN